MRDELDGLFHRRSRSDIAADCEDRRVRRFLKERAVRLSSHPEMQGKPLGGDLAGLRSIRAVGQRYRIVYELFPEEHEVWVIAVGIRKAGDRDDVYEAAKRI